MRRGIQFIHSTSGGIDCQSDMAVKYDIASHPSGNFLVEYHSTGLITVHFNLDRM